MLWIKKIAMYNKQKNAFWEQLWLACKITLGQRTRLVMKSLSNSAKESELSPGNIARRASKAMEGVRVGLLYLESAM